MKLEDQVVSLELAKKLKELGVKQESVFKWERSCSNGLDGWNVIYAPKAKEHVFAAFTVAELGEMLPKKLFSKEFCHELELVSKHDMMGYGLYQFECVYYSIDIEQNTSEADARAKMLIYLIENNLITV